MWSKKDKHWTERKTEANGPPRKALSNTSDEFGMEARIALTKLWYK